MARETCARCKGPREFNSPSVSYCIECNREYQREYYKRTQQARGRTVTSRRQDASATTAEGFQERVEFEKRQSLNFIQFVQKLHNSTMPLDGQILNATNCGLCEKPVITKGNCNLVERRWVLPGTLEHVDQSKDDRAVSLFVALVCNDCNTAIMYLQEIKKLVSITALLELNNSKIQALLPESATVPEFAQYPGNTMPKPEFKQPAYDFVPMGPPVTPEPEPEPETPNRRYNPIDTLPFPDYIAMSTEDLIAAGPEAFSRRLAPESEQWYENWTYYMSKRNLIIDDELCDEDRWDLCPEKHRDPIEDEDA